MLSEINYARKDKYHMFSFVGAENVDFMEVESRLIVIRGWESWSCDEEKLVNGYEIERISSSVQ